MKKEILKSLNTLSLPFESKYFKYPRLYWTPNDKNFELRILYPNKKVDVCLSTGVWKSDDNIYDSYSYDESDIYRNPYGVKKKVNLLKQLKQYCDFLGIECIFIGEIK